MQKGCLNCRKFVTCSDPKKGSGYRCEKYSPQPKPQTLDFNEMMREREQRDAPPKKKKKKTKKRKKKGAKSEFDLKSQRSGRTFNVTDNPEHEKRRRKAKDLAIKQTIAEIEQQTDIGSLDDNDDPRELRLEKLLDGIFSDRSAAMVDLKVDDRDLKMFPNFYAFCSSRNGLNIRPFARQLWVGLQLFGEYCPRCSDKRFIKNIFQIPVDAEPEQILDRVQLLYHGVCPSCKVTRPELINKGELCLYQELDACIGQRAGKSITTSMLCGYATHIYLKLQRPTEVYGLLRDSILTGTFVGLTFKRAFNLLWMPFHNMLKSSPWFSEYHNMLDYYSEKYGEELYKFKDIFIQYSHRNMYYYVSGPSKRTLRGDCLVGRTLVNTSQGFLHFNEMGFSTGIAKAKKLEVAGPRGPRKVSHTYKKVDRQTIKIRTRNGFIEEGTPEHPMLVFTSDLRFKWVRMDQLRTGDFIVSRTKFDNPLFGTENVSKDMATLLGTFTANGFRHTISSDDPKVIKRFYKAAKVVTGKLPKYTPGTATRAANHYVLTNGRGRKGSILDILAQYGYDSRKSKYKQIPKSIRCAPKEILHEYLEAYFACDSHINGGKTGGVDNSGVEVELSTASKKLATQLQVILLQVYGLVGRLRKNVEYKDMYGHGIKRYVTWVLTYTGYDAKLFSQTFVRAKANRYKDRITSSPKGVGSDRRKVPHLRGYLAELIDDRRVQRPGKYRSRQLTMADGNVEVNKLELPFPVHSKRREGSSYNGVPEHFVYDCDWTDALAYLKRLDITAYKRIRKLLVLQPHFEEVVSIKRRKRKVPVYDLTVPEGHAFTANGLVSHNTRIIAATDEVGWFPYGEDNEERERQSADGVYDALDRSLGSVRSAAHNLIAKGRNVPMALAFNISSPQSKNDKIMELVKVNENSRYALAIHLPTWEFNPNMPRDNPVIQKAYADNYAAADRDYGANPPLNDSPYLDNIKALRAMFGPRPNKVEYKYTVLRDARNSFEQRAARITGVRTVGLVPPSVLSIDAGFSNNSFAIAVSHPRQKGNGVELINDALVELQAVRKKIQINFTYVTERIIYELIEKFNVRYVLTDRYQNIKMMHDIQNRYRNVTCEQFTLKYHHFVDLRVYLQSDNSMMRFPALEMTQEQLDAVQITDYPACFKYRPASHLLYQMMTVRDLGKTVAKGERLTDDLFRAVALSMVRMLSKDFCSELMKQGSGKGGVGLGAGVGLSVGAGSARMSPQELHRMRQSTNSGAGRMASRSGFPEPQIKKNATP